MLLYRREERVWCQMCKVGDENRWEGPDLMSDVKVGDEDRGGGRGSDVRYDCGRWEQVGKTGADVKSQGGDEDRREERIYYVRCESERWGPETRVEVWQQKDGGKARGAQEEGTEAGFIWWLGVPHCRGKGGWKSLGRTLLKVNGGGLTPNPAWGCLSRKQERKVARGRGGGLAAERTRPGFRCKGGRWGQVGRRGSVLNVMAP